MCFTVGEVTEDMTSSGLGVFCKAIWVDYMDELYSLYAQRKYFHVNRIFMPPLNILIMPWPGGGLGSNLTLFGDTNCYTNMSSQLFLAITADTCLSLLLPIFLTQNTLNAGQLTTADFSFAETTSMTGRTDEVAACERMLVEANNGSFKQLPIFLNDSFEQVSGWQSTNRIVYYICHWS